MENSTCNDDTPIILPERYVDVITQNFNNENNYNIYIFKSEWFKKQYIPKEKACININTQ